MILSSSVAFPLVEDSPTLALFLPGEQHGESSKCRFGAAFGKNVLGHAFEDRHYARIIQRNGQEIAMFGVFDGHKGAEVADYLRQHLFDAILSHPRFDADPKAAIAESYLALDQRILALGNTIKRSGSTATTCLLFDGSKLIVANVGDSRAVLCRGGEAVAVSVDHDPQKPEEREMVESKGGEVSLTIGGIFRVDRRLAMSRAFGDYELKDHISVEPDIWESELSSEDDFFIVASDGLWHKVTSDEAVGTVQKQRGALAAAEDLVRLSQEKKETDDITVIVVAVK